MTAAMADLVTNPMNDSITDEKCRSLVIFYLTQGNVVFAIIDPADFQKYSTQDIHDACFT